MSKFVASTLYRRRRAINAVLALFLVFSIGCSDDPGEEQNANQSQIDAGDADIEPSPDAAPEDATSPNDAEVNDADATAEEDTGTDVGTDVGTDADENGEPEPQYTDELSQFGITWTFDDDVQYGQFANGDYWVVGPATIVDIDPSSEEDDGRTMNGSMINPVAENGSTQGYDSAMAVSSYDADMNVALDVSTDSPLVVEPGSSLVSTITIEEEEHRPQISDSAVLTVLEEAAAEGSFRPPYSGDDKAIEFNLDDLDYSRLERLDLVDGTPDMADIESKFERPWVDHIPNWNGREAYPSNNMPGYGREIARDVGMGALMLNLDFSDEEKQTLLTSFVQLGIDYHAVAIHGGDANWAPNGGHASGRKFPILFAGMLLDDDEMKAIGDDDEILFGEDAQTFYVEETAPGEYNGGHGGYTEEHEGMAEWGIRHATDRSRDDVDWGASYRRCCTANAWGGFVLAAHIMDAVELWNHDALFDYQDRYMDIEEPGDYNRSWDRPFSEEMWDTYRDDY